MLESIEESQTTRVLNRTLELISELLEESEEISYQLIEPLISVGCHFCNVDILVK